MYTDFFSSITYTLTFLIEKTAIFWAPIGLTMVAWHLWVHYIRRMNIMQLKWVMLEVRIPKEIMKTPEAMEMILANAFYQTGGVGTWFHRWWLGNVLSWFSLEIVSIGGSIHFFIRTQQKFRRLIEAQIYAQYPEIEVSEVSDYVERIPPHTKGGEWSLWGTEFVLSKADIYPIKTYGEYGKDIDPITSVIEFMGSLNKGEELWFQILIRPATGAGKDRWKDEAKAEIKKIRAEHKPKLDGGAFEPMTKGETEMIAAIEKSVSKLAFECGIRGIYLARKDDFDAANITGLTGTFRQFNSENLNGFKVKNATAFDLPWQDLTGKKAVDLKKDMLKAYRLRSYFYPPFKRKPFVLTTEELATIYHFPGSVVQTPSFEKIDSKKTEPPTNLPA